MSLTGVPLIVVAALVGLAAGAATIRWWNRFRPARAAGILLTELLLLVTIGLVVNRSEQFYPSWSALLPPSTSRSTAAYATRAGRLDRSIRALPGRPFSFTWTPKGWTAWHLSVAPTVVTPAGYAQHPTWRYPVVMMLGDATAAAPPADPVVVVHVRTTSAAAAGSLAVDLPGRLIRDLRVSSYCWALVAVGADAGLARQVVRAEPGRYPALAVAGPVPAHRAALAALPVGITTRTFHGPGLTAALSWVVRQTPPPLAASAPPVTYLPHHPHPHPRPSPGGTSVARQSHG